MTILNRRGLLSGGCAVLAAPFLAGRAVGAPVPPADATGHAAGTVPDIRLPGDITSGERATVRSIRTVKPLVAMTFDDGPHSKLTPLLLDMLAVRGLRATFYVIGNRVDQHPALVQRMLAEGHEVGNHSWSHPFLSSLDSDGVIAQLDATTRAVFRATGKVPVTMRPPYGALHARQRLMVHERRNLPTVLWSVDPEDWRRPGAEVVAERILHHTRPGGIVLSHDIHAPTIRAMPATLDGLTLRGFSFVTVSEMLGWPRWQTRNFRLAIEG
jgi:peptidoglycan/xylan/chitin deacetylase (PgdA/CDA1 family)